MGVIPIHLALGRIWALHRRLSGSIAAAATTTLQEEITVAEIVSIPTAAIRCAALFITRARPRSIALLIHLRSVFVGPFVAIIAIYVAIRAEFLEYVSIEPGD